MNDDADCDAVGEMRIRINLVQCLESKMVVERQLGRDSLGVYIVEGQSGRSKLAFARLSF